MYKANVITARSRIVSEQNSRDTHEYAEYDDYQKAQNMGGGNANIILHHSVIY